MPTTDDDRALLARARTWFDTWLKDARRRRGGHLLPFNLGSPSARLVLALVASLLVLLATFVMSVRYLSAPSSGDEISFSELGRLITADSVKQATFFDHDHRVTGTYVEAGSGTRRMFTATYPASDTQTPDLIAALLRSGADVSVDAQGGKAVVGFVATYLLPLVILANLFALIFLGSRSKGEAGGLVEFASIGKGRGGTSTGNATTFADVAGAQEALIELSEVADYLRDPQRYAAVGAKPPKGVMMLGPPGCGKTLMARAVAGEAGVPFFSISGAEFVESLVGVGAARVRDLFRQVRAVAPAIVFIDEIDAAARRRGGIAGGQEEREQTLNQLLVEMDGFDPTSGVVVIAATNRPDILDPALLRPGRFDRQVTVEPPDLDGRIAILKLYTDKSPMDASIDLEYLARRTSGFTGAELANVVNEAALLALRATKTVVGMPEYEEAVQRVGSGPKTRGHVLTPEERLRSAHHEAAHVIVGAVTGRLADIPRVSIVAHGRTLAGTGAKAWAERTLLTRGELFDELATLMAGMVAEELLFGEPSTGSDTDLERATALAQLMVGRYGMNNEIGRLRLLHVEGSEFLSTELVPALLTGEAVLDRLYAETKLLVDDAFGAAQGILLAHRADLDRIAAGLLDHEALEGAELEPMVAHLRRPASSPHALAGVLPEPDPSPAAPAREQRIRPSRRTPPQA